MKYPLVHSIGTLSVAGFMLCQPSTHAEANFAKSFSDALEKVNAQCPENYPKAVTAIPEPEEVSSIDTQKLMTMLENWNPSLRKTAAAELGKRGKKLIPALEKGTQSQSWKVRAGSASALAAIIKHELQKSGSESDKVIKKHSSTIDEFLRLSKDPHIEVRRATFEALSTMAPQTKEATKAMLTLCIDEDNPLITP
jgi:HEAT repeat protein